MSSTIPLNPCVVPLEGNRNTIFCLSGRAESERPICSTALKTSFNRMRRFSASYVVVRFPEESNRTLSFADFLIGLCEILKDTVDDEPLWAELFSRVQTEEDDARVVDTLAPAIREQNRRRNRTLLIMLENLGEIFTRQIRDNNELASLRRFLMADNGCLLLATSPLHFDAITDVGQPFYDFFDVQILENLSFEETVEGNPAQPRMGKAATISSPPLWTCVPACRRFTG